MAYLGKTYKFKKHEKFDEFLVAFGVPKAAADAVNSYKSSQTLEKNGDTYTLTIQTHEGTKTISFKSGEEFDEEIGDDKSKTTFVINGNTIVQTQKLPNGNSMTFKMDFTDNELVMTATNNVWDGVAYRYYSAV